MATQEFTVNTANHVATIPGIGEFEFHPEAYSGELLDARIALTAAQAKYRAADTAEEKARDTGTGELDADAVATQTEALKALNATVKGFVGDLMIEDSKERWLATKLPDRTVVEVQNWILGVYGLRPTSPSNGSSPSSQTTPQPGDDSTVPSPSEEPTL